MRQRAGYLGIDSGPDLKGLATSVRPTALDPAFSPNLLNCTVRDGVVRRRAGYHQLGQDLIGPVLAITEFGEINDIPIFLAFTSQRQYWYDASQDPPIFVDITKSNQVVNITAVTSGGAGSGDFTVAEDLSFLQDGHLIRVEGSTGNNGIYTVSGTSGTGPTVVSVDEAVPSAVADGTLDAADGLISAEADILNFAEMTDPTNGRRIILTNGRGTPQVWDGDTSGDFADWSPTYTNFVTMKTIKVFSDHLFLGNVVTNDFEETLVAWSDSEDFDEFEAGTAGAQLLAQLKGPIKAMEILGDRLVIYSDDAIINGTFIDLPAVFAFETVIQSGTRLVSSKAIISIDLGHIFLSEENFYLYDGTRGLREIGNPIYTDYKTNKDQDLLYQCASLNDFSKRVLYFSVPSAEGGFNVYTIEYDIYNLSNLVFSKEQYNDDPRSWGFFTNRDALLTWDDAPWEPPNNPWSDEIGQWAEEAEQLAFPIRAFGTTSGKVMIATEGALADVDTIKTQLYETKDFTPPPSFLSQHGRWLEVEIEATGSDVEVSYSTDLGRTYTVSQSLELDREQRRYRVPVDTVQRTFRVRLRSLTGFFNLHWLRVWVREGGPR